MANETNCCQRGKVKSAVPGRSKGAAAQGGAIKEEQKASEDCKVDKKKTGTM
jgi:hypothetical protein